MTAAYTERAARFERLCETYGGNLNLWPEDVRAWADAALLEDPALRASLEQAVALDATLDDAPAPPRLSADRIGTILAAAPENALQRKRGLIFWPFGSVWRPAAGLVTAMALGISIGAIYPSAASLSTPFTSGIVSSSSGDFAVPQDIVDPSGDVGIGDLD